jgi:hypothetical protein
MLRTWHSTAACAGTQFDWIKAQDYQGAIFTPIVMAKPAILKTTVAFLVLVICFLGIGPDA